MSVDELEAMGAMFRRRREAEQQEREDFLGWVRDVAEAEEKAELEQRVRNLELQNESLMEFTEQQNVERIDAEREEFDRDLMLSDQAEVLADMLADEDVETESDDAEPTDNAESSEQATEPNDDYVESDH